MFTIILFALIGFVFGSMLADTFLPRSASGRRALVVMGLVASLGAGLGAGAGVWSNRVEQGNQAAQAQMREKATAKYRLVLDKDQHLPLSGTGESEPVIAYVDGQMRECSLRVVEKDPFVFCGAGVEADRSR